MCAWTCASQELASTPVNSSATSYDSTVMVWHVCLDGRHASRRIISDKVAQVHHAQVPAMLLIAAQRCAAMHCAKGSFGSIHTESLKPILVLFVLFPTYNCLIVTQTIIPNTTVEESLFGSSPVQSELAQHGLLGLFFEVKRYSPFKHDGVVIQIS